MEKLYEAGKVLSGAITAGAIIIGSSWYIAKPHAENFIKETVEDEVTKLKHQLEAVTTTQSTLVTQQQLILDLLRAKERAELEDGQ